MGVLIDRFQGPYLYLTCSGFRAPFVPCHSLTAPVKIFRDFGMSPCLLEMRLYLLYFLLLFPNYTVELLIGMEFISNRGYHSLDYRVSPKVLP